MTLSHPERENRKAAAEKLPFHILAAKGALANVAVCLRIGARLGMNESCDLHSVELDLKELLVLVKKMRAEERMAAE